MEQIFLYFDEPLVARIFFTILSRHTGLAVLEKTELPNPLCGKPGDVLVIDTDCFPDIREMADVLHDLALSGRRVVALCPFPEAALLPAYPNLLTLEKPYRLTDVLRFIQQH